MSDPHPRPCPLGAACAFCARADLAQTPETGAPVATGATKPASPSEDTGETITGADGETWARLIHDLDHALNTDLDDPEISAAEQWYVDEFSVDCSTHTLLRVLARGLLAAGWTPPLPDSETEWQAGGLPVGRSRCRMTESTSLDLPPITRPNGKIYRPRKLVAYFCEESACAYPAVVVFGTHDNDVARPLALAEAKYRLEDGPMDLYGTKGWWRDTIRNGERVWEYDEERGRAGINYEIEVS